MTERLILVLKGFCMGIADVIPGVSGGTMALVLGIYERLVGAIGAIGGAFFRAVFRGAFWRRFFAILVRPANEGADAVDHHAGNAAFLAVLVFGILSAALTGVKIIPTLLTEYREPTMGFFFGLVLASVLVPFRLMGRRGAKEALAFALAIVGTFLLVGLQVDDTANARGELRLAATGGQEIRLDVVETRLSTYLHEGNPKREILFMPAVDSAEVVLPASGEPVTVPIVAQMAGEEGNRAAGEVSHLLQPKGQAVRVTQEAPLSGGANPALWYIFLCGAVAICAMILPGISGSFILLLMGQYFYVLFTVHEIVYGRDMGRLAVLGAFLGGILVGIAAFSRLLKWLLARFPSVLMAVLIGLMLGSLRKIWPFQAMTPEGTQNRLPLDFDGTVGATILTFAIGLAIVLVLDWLGQRKTSAP